MTHGPLLGNGFALARPAADPRGRRGSMIYRQQSEVLNLRPAGIPISPRLTREAIKGILRNSSASVESTLALTLVGRD